MHEFISDNINAPLPGTFDPSIPNSGTRPSPALGNIYQYESVGIFEQNQLITNFSVRAARNISLFGFYSFSHVDSDTGGPSSFPDNPYNIAQDYGRAAFDIRHRVVVGGSIALKHGIQLSPLINFQSGSPFNITIGQDLNGSTIFNQRPSFATASTPAADIVSTRYGNFNIDPAPGDPLIPINYGVGPNNFVANLRVSKTFAFGNRTGEHAVGDSGAPPPSSGGIPQRVRATAESEVLQEAVEAIWAAEDSATRAVLVDRQLRQINATPSPLAPQPAIFSTT